MTARTTTEFGYRYATEPPRQDGKQPLKRALLKAGQPVYQKSVLRLIVQSDDKGRLLNRLQPELEHEYQAYLRGPGRPVDWDRNLASFIMRFLCCDGYGELKREAQYFDSLFKHGRRVPSKVSKRAHLRAMHQLPDKSLHRSKDRGGGVRPPHSASDRPACCSACLTMSFAAAIS